MQEPIRHCRTSVPCLNLSSGRTLLRMRDFELITSSKSSNKWYQVDPGLRVYSQPAESSSKKDTDGSESHEMPLCDPETKWKVPQHMCQRSHHYQQVQADEAEEKVDSYQEAVRCLNSLQSNASVLRNIKETKDSRAQENIPEVEKHLLALGISPDDLDRLNVIHVSGTKGKGSTCAFVESILQKHDISTGFYSSPHLVAARERIRINGEPLSEAQFTSYFWQVYHQIRDAQGDGAVMPPYFRFLTLMAFYVFLEEKVDVAILEVGIGGQYDCTNVVRNPVVVGITSLDLDHMHILGHSIEQIAWHKAGIMKVGRPAFSVPQSPGAMNVIRGRAKEIGSHLYEVDMMKVEDWSRRGIPLGLNGEVQAVNASLALQLARIWLQVHPSHCRESRISLPEEPPPIFPVSDREIHGLSETVWPGRCQVFKRGRVIYCLDGAHTCSSMSACVKWFSGILDSVIR
ncbi:unnamed protein product [Darwinula stevensoni]|uniref:tetrahydrofolate synthase n=1 Tax=Darwinula stevensoni TaxID=69355 RepID=A0A7R8X7H7_9CRUS|nr:unnamed protein product [Darwinula stevensoni]CAG0889126.1 unnamed protein product [Darwinula stevensoni]